MGIFEFVTKGNKKQSGTKTQTAKRQTKPNDYSGSGSIMRCTPKSFDDVASCIDKLMDGNPVIVDVSAVSTAKDATSSATAQRVIDLMSGAIYAIDGNMGELSKDVYVFTPRGMKA